jgi:sec-independent protein translocase protein TatB
VFGFSFGELLVICVVALIAVGPKKLPGMLHTLGQWLRKIRNLTTEVRNQTGIDDLLRSEGLNGGLNELRGLLRGNHSSLPFEAPVPQPAPRAPIEDPYANVEIDVSREYPQEGADAHGALPDDLLQDYPPKQDSAAEPAVADAVPDATAGPTESA